MGMSLQKHSQRGVTFLALITEEEGYKECRRVLEAEKYK